MPSRRGQRCVPTAAWRASFSSMRGRGCARRSAEPYVERAPGGTFLPPTSRSAGNGPSRVVRRSRMAKPGPPSGLRLSHSPCTQPFTRLTRVAALWTHSTRREPVTAVAALRARSEFQEAPFAERSPPQKEHRRAREHGGGPEWDDDEPKVLRVRNAKGPSESWRPRVNAGNNSNAPARDLVLANQQSARVEDNPILGLA
jgi:hypothetical protein